MGPQDVGFVSVHGTGTPLGDPIEVGALGQGLAVGSGGATRVTLGASLCNSQLADCMLEYGQ